MLPRSLTVVPLAWLCACAPSGTDFGTADPPAEHRSWPETELPDDGEEPDWDTSPPQATDGMRITGTINCGWLDGSLERAWTWDGDAWAEEHLEGDVQAWPDLTACYTAAAQPEFDHRLAWYEDGTMFFQAGGLDHDLWPAASDFTWLGEVVPTGGPSPECLEALEERGIVLPVIMQLVIHSIDAPS